MFKKLINLYKKNSKRNLTKDRFVMNKYVIMNIIIKYITFLPAYYLNKKKISPDTITILSYLPIIISSIFFIINDVMLACMFMTIALILDSLDGDLARLKKTKTEHGHTIDVIGADIFYFFIPISICYNLSEYQNINYVFFYDEKKLILIGFLITVCLIFYRLIGVRNYVLLIQNKNIVKKKNIIKKKFSSTFLIFKYLENDIIRGNFFSEPGFTLNFLLLFFLKQFQFIYYYLIIILMYHSLRFSKLFFGTIYFYIKK